MKITVFRTLDAATAREVADLFASENVPSIIMVDGNGWRYVSVIKNEHTASLIEDIARDVYDGLGECDACHEFGLLRNRNTRMGEGTFCAAGCAEEQLLHRRYSRRREG